MRDEAELMWVGAELNERWGIAQCWMGQSSMVHRGMEQSSMWDGVELNVRWGRAQWFTEGWVRAQCEMGQSSLRDGA